MGDEARECARIIELKTKRHTTGTVLINHEECHEKSVRRSTDLKVMASNERLAQRERNAK